MTPWVAPDDCCGYCKIEVPTVRIVYWPPQTAAPNVSYTAGNMSVPHFKRSPVTVVEDGYTFTSPSVYIVYSSISASASCIAMSQTYHTVGGTHVVTRAYPPDHLSSVRCVNSLGVGQGKPSVVWEAIDYNDLHSDIPLTKSLSRVDRCFTDRKDDEVWGDWMRKPFISLPKDVSELDPAWTTCSGVAIGAMDPPRALVPANGFEDSPPADPIITQASPDPPAATPGRSVPDPVSGPTSKPLEESSPKVTAQPDPPNDRLTAPDNSPRDPLPIPAPASAVVKESSKSPAVAAPLPQQPSGDYPIAHQGDASGPPPEGEKDITVIEKPSSRQQLDDISSALFPDLPNEPAGDRTGSGTANQGQPVESVGQPSRSNVGGSDEPDRDPDDGPAARPGSTKQGSEDNTPGMENPPNQHVSGNVGSPATGSHPPASADGGAAGPKDPSNDRIPQAAKDQSNQENTAETENRGSTELQDGTPFAADSGISGSQQEAARASQSINTDPITFAFVSNTPPPIAGNPNIDRASDGAAIIGTATIHPGSA
ncbi:MAG: hypothetical protein Q9174_006442 [Haloplaca sp. 1 TL-2023]